MIPRHALIFLISVHLLAACGSSTPASPETAAASDPGTQAPADSHVTTEPTTAAPAQPEAQPAPAIKKPVPGPVVKELGPGPMPAQFAPMHDILKAASLKNEPGNLAFNTHSEPSVTLRWFGRFGTTDHVRIFALRGLGLYPTPSNSAVLAKVAMSEAETVAVRAAAIAGLGRYDLESSDHEKVKEFIFATIRHKDLELARAAAEAMHGMPTARPILLELVGAANTAAPLKAAAERALGPQVE